MKENHIRDPLEDYFRQNLSDYEKAPPDDLWERVEADLASPAAAAPQPWWEPYRFLLAAAAAAALVVLTLIDPTRSWHRSEPALAPMPLDSDTAARSADNLTALVLSFPRDQKCGLVPPEEQLSALPELSVSRTPAISAENLQKQPRRAPSFRFWQPEISPASIQQEYFSKHPPTAYEKKQTPNSTELITSLNPLINSDQAAEEVLAEQTSALPSLGAPSSLPPLCLSVESGCAPGMGTMMPQPLTTRLARPLRGWTLGLYASWMYTLPPQVTLSVQAPPPGRPFRPAVLSQPQEQRPSLALGVRAGKHISARRWGMEVGLVFLENKNVTVHVSRFRFGDGRKLPGGGGHFPSRREFSYSLNTYGGSAAIDLRMEPTNTSDPLLNTEPVVMRAEAIERTQWLHVPLLATYTIGNGRLLSTVRAGVVADVLLKSELNLTSFVSQNHRLQLALGDSPTIAWTPARSLSVGYWLSVGATYHWSRHWLLSLEPAIVGAFAHRDAEGRPLPLPVSLGGQLGLVHMW